MGRACGSCLTPSPETSGLRPMEHASSMTESETVELKKSLAELKQGIV